MRVLMVSREFPPSDSSQALQVGKVADAIAGQGVELRVLAGVLDRETDRAHFDRENRSYDVVFVPFCSPSYLVEQPATPARVRVWRRVRGAVHRSKWMRQALAAGRDLLRSFSPDVVITFSTPIDAHRVGLELRRTSSVPWIASFSDPWPARLLPAPYNAGRMPFFELWQMRILRQILRSCSAIHMSSRYAVAAVERGSGMRMKEKSCVIPHVGHLAPRNPKCTEPQWLGHVGAVGHDRVSRPLLQAVADVAGDASAQFAGVVWVGGVCEQFSAAVSELGVRESVRILGRVGFEEAFRLATSVRALLAIEAEMAESPFLPSKFADYACARRPILAITPPVSAIRDYLSTYGGGYAVAHDRQEIAAALRKIFADERDRAAKGQGNPNGGLATHFEPHNVGCEYLRMIESVLAKGQW